MPWDPELVETAIAHIKERDEILAGVIDAVGPFQLKLDRNRFQMLVWSILSQQISGKAARSIRNRLLELIAPDRVTADRLAALSVEELRSAGVSPQKAKYIHDLAAKVADGTVQLSRVGKMTDEQIITERLRNSFGTQRTLRTERAARSRKVARIGDSLATLCHDRQLVLLAKLGFEAEIDHHPLELQMAARGSDRRESTVRASKGRVVGVPLIPAAKRAVVFYRLGGWPTSSCVGSGRFAR
ncbi:MAG: hypothetical protein NT069_11365 [Planctomycetota bacterium]|nr:hypothetical protein [Planctomycetota bacterium]